MSIPKERYSPTYSLDAIRQLAQGGKLTINRRARSFITNRHGRLDVSSFVVGLVFAIKPRDFYKSVELDVMPGVWGDVYRNVAFEDEEWYVKLAVLEDGTASLCVLSANWEGYMH